MILVMAPKLLSRRKRSTLNGAKQTRGYAGPKHFSLPKVHYLDTHELERHDKDNPNTFLISLRKQLSGITSDKVTNASCDDILSVSVEGTRRHGPGDYNPFDNSCGENA